MKIIEKVVPNNFNIFCVGDQHIGCIQSNTKIWNKMVDMVNSEIDGIKPRNNFVVDHGDSVEAIDILDKRFDIQSIGRQDENGNIIKNLRYSQILYQYQQSVIDRQEIRKNYIVMLKGNHDHKLLRFGNFVKDYLCERLGVRYGTISCVIEYKDRNGNLLFKHYAHHGFGTIRSIAHPTKRRFTNKEISLMQKFDSKFGDCLLNTMGHTHQLIVCKPNPVLYMTTENGEIKQKYTKPSKTKGYIEPNHRWYGNVGCFMQTYVLNDDGYGERRGFDPVQLGFLLVKVRDRNIVGIDKVI